MINLRNTIAEEIGCLDIFLIIARTQAFCDCFESWGLLDIFRDQDGSTVVVIEGRKGAVVELVELVCQ